MASMPISSAPACAHAPYPRTLPAPSTYASCRPRGQQAAPVFCTPLSPSFVGPCPISPRPRTLSWRTTPLLHSPAPAPAPAAAAGRKGEEAWGGRRVRWVGARARGDDDSVDAPQRILAALPYFLPLLDGARYGRYLYMQYGFVRALLDPIVPLIQLYNSVPFAGFVAFFVLYLAVIQNPSLSRYVRYNAMQAVILDILMILPALLERLFSFRDGVGFQLTVVFDNTVFLYLFACFAFGVGSCLLGKTPRLPLVADAAEAQVPF